jgi:hypothetical protein
VVRWGVCTVSGLVLNCVFSIKSMLEAVKTITEGWTGLGLELGETGLKMGRVSNQR